MTGSSGSTASPHVLVLLGTDHHPFDRLVRWVEEWLSGHGTEVPSVLVQHGFTQQPPRGEARASYVPFLDHRELDRHLGGAAAVVCHGGPGTIADCRRAGLVPVVLPRSAAHGEHVDDHQVRYAGRLHGEGLVRTVDDAPQLREELASALLRPRQVLAELDRTSVAATVSTFAELVAGAARHPGAVGRRRHVRGPRRSRG